MCGYINLIPLPYVSFPNLRKRKNHRTHIFIFFSLFASSIQPSYGQIKFPAFQKSFFHIFIISSRLMFHVKLTVRNFLKILPIYFLFSCITMKKVEKTWDWKWGQRHFLWWEIFKYKHTLEIATIACGIYGLKKLFIYLFYTFWAWKTINVHLLIINAILYFVAPIVCLLLCSLLFVVCGSLFLYMYTTNLYFH